MNYATQAARDILGKIERDPAEVRHWRQLLILCFDQKDVETIQTMQTILGGIEQIWNRKRQQAKEAHEIAKQKQRSTGSKEPLPALAVISISLTTRQKESLVKLAQAPQNPALLYRFGMQLEEELDLSESAQAIYESALSHHPDNESLEQKIVEGIKRCQERQESHAPRVTTNLGGIISPEPLGAKSPSHLHPSTASLFRRSGRLSVDRGRISSHTDPLQEQEWAELQKTLDETMARLQAHAGEVCETAPRPMRLPRSIAPSQWIEFLEDHLTLLIATLEAQGVALDLTTDPDDAPPDDAKRRAGLLLTLMGEIDQSLSSFATTPPSPTGPLPPVGDLVRIEEIFEQIDQGALADAERDLRRIEKDTPGDQLSEVWFHLGLAYQKDQQRKSAITAYQQACDLNAGNLEAWFNSGMIMHEEGMLRPAHDCYVHAADIDPEQPKIWCNLGVLQFQLGEFEASVSSLNKAVRLKPDYARAWDNLAGSLCAVDQLPEAERCCHRAINFRSDYPDPHFKLGSIYFQQGRTEEAEKAFRRVLEYQPGYPLAGHYLAMLLARAQRLPEALAICENAAVPPGETELPSLAWNEMAFSLYEKGEYVQALSAYKKALTFTPDRAVIWLDAGATLHQLQELDQARAHYEQAIDLDPELARAWHNLGTVRHDLGDKPGAKAAFEEADRLLSRK